MIGFSKKTGPIWYPVPSSRNVSPSSCEYMIRVNVEYDSSAGVHEILMRIIGMSPEMYATTFSKRSSEGGSGNWSSSDGGNGDPSFEMSSSYIVSR